jgi:hypothetical protein
LPVLVYNKDTVIYPIMGKIIRRYYYNGC